MKSLLALAIIFPAMAMAQTQEDYIKMMSRFVKYYNNNQPDSICKLFKPQPKLATGCIWTYFERAHNGKTSLQEYGKVIDYDYLGKDTVDPNDLGVFKVVYENIGTVAMSFSLEDKQFGTFRHITNSPEIARMMKNAK